LAGKEADYQIFSGFGSKCYILQDWENLDEFDAKSDEGIFLGYSSNSRAYRVFNKRTGTVMESINVVIDDEEIGTKGELLQITDPSLETSDPSVVTVNPVGNSDSP